jgi:hypothetical protein
MTKEGLSQILDQLYEAQQKGLIHDYMHLEHHQYIYIMFNQDTSEQTKVALSEYFTSSHNTENVFMNMEQMLRIDFSE